MYKNTIFPSSDYGINERYDAYGTMTYIWQFIERTGSAVVFSSLLVTKRSSDFIPNSSDIWEGNPNVVNRV